MTPSVASAARIGSPAGTATLRINAADVRAAAENTVALAGTLATVIDNLAAAPQAVIYSAGLAGNLAVDLASLCTGLRTDFTTLLDFARALGAGQAEITAVDDRLAQPVPMPRNGGNRLLGLPIHLSETVGTLLLESVVHALPPGTLRELDPLLAEIPDGPGWAQAAGSPQQQATSPATPAAWLATVSAAQARPGQITVTRLANDRWVVSLPGIHTMTEAPDPLDLAGAAHAFATGHGAYAGAVIMAMTLAGVPKGADIMLVGHSQGGIVAADLAADPDVEDRWRITHLLTAASPIGATKLPVGTATLELRNREDIVPQLDLAPPPDPAIPSNRVSVSFDSEHGSIGANHDLAGTYTPFAQSRAFATDPGVIRWEDAAAGYLRGGPATTQTFQLLDRAPVVPAPSAPPAPPTPAVPHPPHPAATPDRE